MMEPGTGTARPQLMREIRAKPGMPAWRMDDDGRRISLIIRRNRQ
jgi:hypothetical protein